MKKPNSSPTGTCHYEKSDGIVDAQRRRVINIVASSLVTPLPFATSNASAQTKTTLLVDADAEGDYKPLRPADLKPTKPLLVYPFDPASGKPKNESRLNKLILVRLPEEQMTPETHARSASGVVAYSGICTHQGCEVKTWMSKESVLACYCHASKFNLFDGAKVVSGPAPSPLPAIPLTLAGEFLALAVNPVKQGE
jgi:rieske iron-sulfur protein